MNLKWLFIVFCFVLVLLFSSLFLDQLFLIFSENQKNTTTSTDLIHKVEWIEKIPIPTEPFCDFISEKNYAEGEW